MCQNLLHVTATSIPISSTANPVRLKLLLNYESTMCHVPGCSSRNNPAAAAQLQKNVTEHRTLYDLIFYLFYRPTVYTMLFSDASDNFY